MSVSVVSWMITSLITVVHSFDISPLNVDTLQCLHGVYILLTGVYIHSSFIRLFDEPALDGEM